MSDSFLCVVVGMVDVEDWASFVAICVCGITIVTLSMSSRPSRTWATQRKCDEASRTLQERKIVTAQQLKDGFRGIGHTIESRSTINNENIKFRPPRKAFRAPDAKKLKYVAFGW